MKDIWHSAILPIKTEMILESVIQSGFIADDTASDNLVFEEKVLFTPEIQKKISAFTLLPSLGPHRFLADPFGVWKDSQLYVFAEAYDYRNRKGRIDVFIYNKDLELQAHSPAVLRTDWHLSYPNVFLHNGEYYMLPEAWKSGKLTLYRAKKFPTEWEEAPEFQFPVGSIDSTPFSFKGRWYMLWTPPEPKSGRQSDLCLAEAPDLFGPWTLHGSIAQGLQGSRCGGTPIIKNDVVYVPIQDCRKTYGAGLRYLELKGLGTEEIKVRRSRQLTLPKGISDQFPDGFHQIASAGDVTLIDFKKLVPKLSVLIPRILAKINPFYEPF